MPVNIPDSLSVLLPAGNSASPGAIPGPGPRLSLTTHLPHRGDAVPLRGTNRPSGRKKNRAKGLFTVFLAVRSRMDAESLSSRSPRPLVLHDPPERTVNRPVETGGRASAPPRHRTGEPMSTPSDTRPSAPTSTPPTSTPRPPARQSPPTPATSGGSPAALAVRRDRYRRAHSLRAEVDDHAHHIVLPIGGEYRAVTMPAELGEQVRRRL